MGFFCRVSTCQFVLNSGYLKFKEGFGLVSVFLWHLHYPLTDSKFTTSIFPTQIKLIRQHYLVPLLKFSAEFLSSSSHLIVQLKLVSVNLWDCNNIENLILFQNSHFHSQEYHQAEDQRNERSHSWVLKFTLILQIILLNSKDHFPYILHAFHSCSGSCLYLIK